VKLQRDENKDRKWREGWKKKREEKDSAGIERRCPIFRDGSSATTASRYESCNVCDRSARYRRILLRSRLSHRTMDSDWYQRAGLDEIFGKGRTTHLIWEDTCRSCRVGKSGTAKSATVSGAITNDLSKAIAHQEEKRSLRWKRRSAYLIHFHDAQTKTFLINDCWMRNYYNRNCEY